MVFNRRQSSGESAVYTRSRSKSSDPWGMPTVVPTAGFADSKGNSIWGEPTFDQSETFMLFIRFNSSDPTCMTPDVMYSPGTPESGFVQPTVLN